MQVIKERGLPLECAANTRFHEFQGQAPAKLLVLALFSVRYIAEKVSVYIQTTRQADCGSYVALRRKVYGTGMIRQKQDAGALCFHHSVLCEK